MVSASSPSKPSWPGLSRPSTSFLLSWTRGAASAGWVERWRNSSSVLPRGTLRDGFRLAQPILQGFIVTALAAAPFAAAQTIEDKAQACAACHGENGIPPDKSWPVIWGQHQGYLYLQLRDFKSGARKDDVMGPVAQALERDDMLAIALYFSQKAWPNLRQARAAAAVAMQAARANASVGCTGCHQAGYQGEGTQPRLAGQSADYMLKSMMDFRTRRRGNNPGMSDLMNATSEDDLKAVAAYLAGL
jgi:cytochrome c553